MSREKESQSQSQSPTPTPSQPADASTAPGRAPRAVQQKGGDSSPEAVQQAAEAGVSGPSQSLPHLDAIQSSFGSHDVGGVEAHLGLNASEVNQMLGSEAYATGNDVAFADSSPSLHTAAHEAAHVVQQRGGVQLKGGVGEAGDRYEQHADQVADTVVAGQSAEALLDQMAPSSSASSSGAGVQRKVVQMRGPEGGSGGSGGSGGASGSGGSEGAGGTGGTGGAASGGEAAGGDAEGGSEDSWETFKQAIAAYNAADAKTAWGKLKKDEKAKLKADGDAQVKLMHTLHKGSLEMFKESGVDWSNHVTNLSVFLMPDFDDWYDELWNHGLYQSFREAYPVKGQVPDSAAKKIQGWMKVVAGDIGAQLLFEKVYPKLNTSPADASAEKVAAWSKDKVVRLYNILSADLPVGHVQTITGGFTLIDKTKEWDDTAKKWTWPTLNFAWWEPWSFRVVLNNSSSGANEGGTGHDMSGGDYSGANNNYNLDDGSAGTQTSQTHFHGSALHEVGHGVGQRMGGDEYALNPGSYPGWTPVDPGAWAEAQWDSGATAGAPPGGLHEDASLDEDDARDFMITEITDGQGSWSSWGNDAPRTQIVTYVNAVYSNQPLYNQWKKVVVQDDGDNAYYTAQTRGDWAYTYLTRWNEPYTAKLKSEALSKKVSWYGVSSPKEWFAEQYAHYYRTEKTGGGLIDPATKALLDRLDSQQFVPTNDDGSEGVVVGGGQAAGGNAAGGQAGGGATPSGARTSGGSGNAADAGGDLAETDGPGGDQSGEDPSRYRTPPQGSRPCFFPW